MKTIKISLVATVALIVGWQLRIPQRMWPAHPLLADLFLSAALCVLLQFAWTEPKSTEPKSIATKSDSEKKI